MTLRDDIFTAYQTRAPLGRAPRRGDRSATDVRRVVTRRDPDTGRMPITPRWWSRPWHPTPDLEGPGAGTPRPLPKGVGRRRSKLPHYRR